MAGRDAGRGDKKDAVRIGRRGFIGAGLAGAGALIVPAGSASARSGRAGVKTVRAHQSGARAGGPIGQLSVRASFPNLPAIPMDPAGVLDTLARLQIRAGQVVQTKQGVRGARKPGARCHSEERSCNPNVFRRTVGVSRTSLMAAPF